MQVCYFASDFHLGAPSKEQSNERERAIVRWLDYAATDATDIFLVGDVFDFWFEYAAVIPKGYSRFFGKLAELADRGIQLHFFYGNHDMWVKQYFTEEFGMKIYANPIQLTLYGKRIYLGHGDGLGPGDYKYKFIKRVFRNPLCQWAFARIHPNFGISLANYFSRSSRKSGMAKDMIYAGKDQEWLYHFAAEHQKTNPQDYYIFGHRHLPLELTIDQAVYLNTGEWLYAQTFARFDGQKLEMWTWKNGQIEAYDAKRPN